MSYKNTFCFCVIFLLTGCSIFPGQIGANQPSLLDQAATPLSPSASNPASPETGEIATEIKPVTLVIWIPDNFSLRSGEQTQKMLMDRMDTFQKSHPDITLDLRYKNVKQYENMLDLLNSTSRVAPAVLPDIVLLTRKDMETAALKGLLAPLDSMESVADGNGIFPGFSLTGTLQGSLFGFPAAGDALVIISSTDKSNQMDTWTNVFSSGMKLGANFNDPDGTLFVTLYLSAGGKLIDDKGKPYLDPSTLTLLLDTMRQARKSAVFPEWTLLTPDWSQVSDRFIAGDVPYQINWYSSVSESAADSFQHSILPGLGDTPATTLTGWYWASSNPAPAKQAARQELLGFLTEPAFGSPWSTTAGYLPVSDQYWPQSNVELLPFQSILKISEPLPENALMTTVGPVLRDAAIRAYTTDDPIEEIVTAAIARINQ